MSLANPTRILVYEFLTAGGRLPGVTDAEHAELFAQGDAMRAAMLQDLAAVPHVSAQAWSGTAPPEQALAAAAAQGWTIWAVAPESNGALEHLARAVPGEHWLGCTPDTIAITGSKRATAAHLARAGVCVPATATGVTGHWVVKPDDGAGATDTRRHATRAAADADAAGRPHPPAVEPWIEGEALSLALCCGPGQAELLAINRQHIEVDDSGSVHFRGVSPAAIAPDSPQGRALAPLVPALAHALPGLGGYVGVDVVLTAAGRPVVIEVNPRLTSAYVGLSKRLGFNVAARLLAAAARSGPPLTPAGR